MTGFDAKRYLRCRGEDSLRVGDSGDLMVRARTLEAVGMVSDEVARTVLDGYLRARVIRDLGHPHFHEEPASVPNPGTRRIVRLGRTIEQAWGTVTLHYISLGAQRTRVAVTIKFTASTGPAFPTRVGPRRRAFPGGGAPTMDLTDDRGTTVSTDFGGGGTDKKWRGHYTAGAGLAQDTRSITVLGERIDLVDDVTKAPVEITTFDQLSPGERSARCLDHILESSDCDGEIVGLEIAVETLIACGALPADSPLIARAVAIAQALQTSRPTSLPDLPERWRSLIEGRRRKRKDVRKGSMVLDVATPPFDGISVSMMHLDSGAEGFDIEIAAYGPIASDASSAEGQPDERTVSFSASDDVGNYYLGGWSDYSGGDDATEGHVRFVPPLHRAATKLDLTLATGRAAATIHIMLDWRERA